jgi:hypothetical protein
MDALGRLSAARKARIAERRGAPPLRSSHSIVPALGNSNHAGESGEKSAIACANKESSEEKEELGKNREEKQEDELCLYPRYFTSLFFFYTLLNLVLD